MRVIPFSNSYRKPGLLLKFKELTRFLIFPSAFSTARSPKLEKRDGVEEDSKED